MKNYKELMKDDIIDNDTVKEITEILRNIPVKQGRYFTLILSDDRQFEVWISDVGTTN